MTDDWLSHTQRELLLGDPVGVFLNGSWLWVLDGRAVSPTVNGLARRGLVRVTKNKAGRGWLVTTEAGLEALRRNAARRSREVAADAAALKRKENET